MTKETTSDPVVGEVWTVLRLDDAPSAMDRGRPRWIEVGTIGTQAYRRPTPDEIGALGGAGEYLLIRDEATGIERVELTARTTYDKVEAET